MAVNILGTYTEAELRRMTPATTRKVYVEVASMYNRIVENKVIHCPMCNDFKLEKDFYKDNNYNSGYFPVCKQCLQFMSEQRKSEKEPIQETKESIQRVLRYMNKPYIDKLYDRIYQRKKSAENGDIDEDNTDIKLFSNYITVVNSLPQYKGMTWDNSDFGGIKSIEEEEVQEVRIIKTVVADGRKRFGSAYSEEELMFLENEYRDWVARYECNTKAQEKVFKNLAMVELQKDKAIRDGKSTKDLDIAYQNWLDAGNLKPKQNSMDNFSDAQTLGTLIQKYEDTRPLPQIDPELEDVDKIGLYIDAFFKGHICKVLGIKNRFFNVYENVMKKYTVSQPQYDEDEDSEAIFDKIFGDREDG